MHDRICEILVENGVQFLYVTNKIVEKTARQIAGANPSFHCESSINEKNAFELALTCSWASKKAACLTSSEGLYEALDPLMSSAYTGVAGGFVIVAVQENDTEITPIGLFSKMPLLVTETAEEFSRAVRYAYHISEKYQIPVIIQAKPLDEKVQGTRYKAQGVETSLEPLTFNLGPHTRPNDPTTPLTPLHPYTPTPVSYDSTTRRVADFVKTPGRWAATPKFRFELHKELNDKVERIRAEHEEYEGNIVTIKDSTGVISDRSDISQFFDEDVSFLKLATVFPLPQKLVSGFVEKMDLVFISETYPAIELQIDDRKKISKGPAGMIHRGPKPDESICGFDVVRDKLGPASSINMAHGIVKSEPDRNILAITYEDFFLHSGMPAFVNSIYNDSHYTLLIMSNNKEGEIRNILRGFGFNNCHTIGSMKEVERFSGTRELTVLFCKGIG